ncbi:VTC domain-containing protein [Acidimicrobiaceae bacterium]|nr:VTC domain-containing protein [Acidimicrobiaceae bacterium]
MIEKRIEQKYLVNQFNLEKFLFHNQKELKNLFNERKVVSRYFDTEDLKLFNDSIDKDYDKFKVRFRRYNESNKITKEIKLTNHFGKYKISSATDYENLEQIENFFYRGHYLVPTVEIEYTRNYFEYKGNRLTIDSYIKFTKTKNKYISKTLNDVFVLEVKKLEDMHETFFLKNPIFNATKFSKYEEGIKHIFMI